MERIKAIQADFPALRALYDEIIDNTPDMDKTALWKRALHPCDDDIRAFVRNGAQYYLSDGTQIAGAMAVTLSQGSDYHPIDWQTLLHDDEVAVVHILGVSPAFQKRGVGGQLVDEALAIARAAGKRALRLDTLRSNIPGQRLYESKGFVLRGTQRLYFENTGWAEFLYYEYLLNGTEDE